MAKDFRKSDIPQITRLVKTGKFCQLICVPGGGKATLLQFLAAAGEPRPEGRTAAHLQGFHFVYLNLLELESYDQPQVNEFLLHSLDPAAKHSPDPFVLAKQLSDTVRQLTAKNALVLLFDHFDEFQNRLSRSFFQTLRTLRDPQKYRFGAVFGTRRDLRQLIDPDLRRQFYDFFVNAVYMKIYDEAATTSLLLQIEQVTGKKLSPEQKKGIINLTAGHAKLTKVVAETVLQENLPLKKEALAKHPAVRAALFELWLFLTAQEQHILTSLSGNKPIPSSEALDNLISFDLIQPPPTIPTHEPTSLPAHNAYFTIPLFAEFVHQNAPTLHQEKISYNPTTREIQKGEEIISELLSPQENRLLRFLIENQNRIVDREEIIQAVWPEAQAAEGVSDEAIDQMIFRLRQKIEDEPGKPQHVLTVKGLGFRFKP